MKIIMALALLCAFSLSNATTTRATGNKITMVYHEDEKGDWVLHLYGNNRQLVCEEKAITVIEPADPVDEPLEIRCKH
jgi:hypothetical protein